MTSISDKAAHVRAATDTAGGSHHCHWPGCTVPTRPATWGCRKHWYMLPAAIRQRIWAAYMPGQEETKTPNLAYQGAAREAQQWIAEHYPQDVERAYFRAVFPNQMPSDQDIAALERFALDPTRFRKD